MISIIQSEMSTPYKVVNLNTFDPNKISFGSVRTGQIAGFKMQNIYYTDGGMKVRPMFKTPYMVSLFGLDRFEGGKPSISLSFKGHEESEKLTELLNAMNALDSRVKQNALDNSVQLFKKTLSEELIDDKHAKIIKYSYDKITGQLITKYAPCMKLKFQMDKQNQINTDLHDAKGECITQVEETLTPKGLTMKALIMPSVCWASGGKFGLGMTLKQVKLNASPEPVGCLLSDDDDDDNDDNDDSEISSI